MPIVTNTGCVRLCKLMKDNFTFWFGVGRTTPWTNESNPPQETANTTVISEIQGFKRVEQVLYVVPDNNGTIIFKGQKYRVVNEQNIYTDGARYLYFSAWLMFDDFPVVTFRQTGLFVDVVPQSGYENYDILLPTQVQSYRMIAYVNHQPRIRVSWGKDLLEMIVEAQGVLTSL